jgi:hypothetical protein
LLEFIKATTQNTPAPDQDPYDFILAQLQSFPIDDESNIDYFDTDHLSSPEYMQFRV